MTLADITKNLPLLLITALLFALIGWWLRGRRKTAPATALAPAAKSTVGPSNSERQRLRDLEAKLRASESSASSALGELASLKKNSVAQTDYNALKADLELANTNAAALDVQLKKSREIQAGLQSQANDAGKKVQARAIGLENELAAARTEIQRLKTLSEPNTEGMKRLESEVETVRTRLRAVEAQLAERNAELNAQKASTLAATVRPPRTVAARELTLGGALNLLGVDSGPPPASPAKDLDPSPPAAVAAAPSPPPAIPENASSPRTASAPATLTRTAAALTAKSASAATSIPAGYQPRLTGTAVPDRPSNVSSTPATPAAEVPQAPPLVAQPANSLLTVADTLNSGTPHGSAPIPPAAAVEPEAPTTPAPRQITDDGTSAVSCSTEKSEAPITIGTPLAAAMSTPVSTAEIPAIAIQQELPLLKLTFADTILPEDSILENPVASIAAALAPTTSSTDSFNHASSLLGKRIKQDDLTIVEGIGPKISELLVNSGVDSWESLAAAGTEELQSILTAAGPAYAIHQADSWPAQARLAAAGKWSELKVLQEELDGGRTS